jgi:FkbM family methyltransferase
MPDIARQMRKHLRRAIRSLGWDIVRYRPLWPTLLGVERLPIRTVLDIGAYDGDTARLFRRFFPQAHIYCFEPQPEPVQTLNAWAVSQQGLVHILPVALGNRSGMAEIHCNARFPRIASLALPAPRFQPKMQDAIIIPTPIMRLDEAVSAEIPLQEGVLIKIDVEGGERDVLAGGAVTLQRCAACILEFHVDSYFIGQMALPETTAFLREYGLEFAGVLQQQLKRDGRLHYFDAIFVNWARGESATPGSAARS